MSTLLNEIASEIEQPFPRFFVGDLTANWHPMMLDEISLSPSEFEDTDIVLEDIRAGLEVENIYDVHGKAAFRTYDEYRQHRLGSSV